MYFRKISNKITVSRYVFNDKKLVKIRLYKTSSSQIGSYDGTATYDVATERTTSTNGWSDTPYSDSADVMYFVEAEFEVDLNESSFTIPSDSFTSPARYLDRYMAIILDKDIARNDSYSSTAMQEISVTINSAYYNSTPLIKAQGVYGNRFIDFTVDGNRVYIPYKNAPNSVIVSAWIGSACVASHRFQVVDKTGMTKYLGKASTIAELDELLANPNNGEIEVAVYVGNEVSSSKYGGTLKCGYSVYSNGNGWTIVDTIDSATANIALSIVKDVAKDTPIVGGPISWFNTIVADTIAANKGIFKNLTVGDFSDDVADILNSVDDKLDSSDLEGYAKSDEIPSLDDYAKRDEIPSNEAIAAWLKNSDSDFKAWSAAINDLKVFQITIPSGGHIQSNGYSDSVTKGFYLGYDGLLKAIGGTFKGTVEASSFSIGNTSMVFKSGVVEADNSNNSMSITEFNRILICVTPYRAKPYITGATYGDEKNIAKAIALEDTFSITIHTDMNGISNITIYNATGNRLNWFALLFNSV